MDNNSSNNLLRIVVEYMKEELATINEQSGVPLTDQDIGKQIALYSVLTLICNEAGVFDVELPDIGLADYNPDRDAFRRGK